MGDETINSESKKLVRKLGNAKPLKVAIDAQLLPGGGAGGVEQFTVGLVYALGRLNDSSEEYIIVGPWQEPAWLESYLGANQHIVSGPKPQRGHMERAQSLLGPLRSSVGELWQGVQRFVLQSPRRSLPRVPESEGFYESLGASVIHFPRQGFVRCNLPMIYSPHDLQHLHYPQFFTQEQIAWRETIYRAGCLQARAIAAESQCVKDDIIRQYGIDARQIYVIPHGSPTELYDPTTDKTLMDATQKFRLPQSFALYPAQTWQHKNHVRLLEATKLLRDRHGLSVNLVCTGRQNDFWPTIEEHMCELGLEEQVHFLGFVGPTELRALYHLAQFVVLPSLFEGGGFPVLEAFQERTPVACSAVTSLPEYGGDAVLLFDPTSVESIAEAMRRMNTDAKLRATLRRRGTARSRIFSCERLAKAYRALYRQVAGCPLSDGEHRLLADSPLDNYQVADDDAEAALCAGLG